MIRDTNIDQSARIAVSTVPFFIPGAITANQTALIRFRLPHGGRLRRIYLNAHTVSGTSPTLSATVKNATDNVTLGTSGNVTTAGTPVKTTVDAAVAANKDISVDLTVGGTSPSFSNITLELVFSICDIRDVNGAAGDVSW